MSRVASRANSSPICQIQLRRICLTRGLREAEQQMGVVSSCAQGGRPGRGLFLALDCNAIGQRCGC